MLDAENENQIQPPKSPITVKINQWILKRYFEYFTKKYLPAFDVQITSSYRTTAENESVGGAANSAHLHGLAYDFILKTGGAEIPQAQALGVYNQFVVPNWPGYTEFEKQSTGEGWHIHVNLSRFITLYAGSIGVAGASLLIIKVIKTLSEGSKKNGLSGQ